MHFGAVGAVHGAVSRQKRTKIVQNCLINVVQKSTLKLKNVQKTLKNGRKMAKNGYFWAFLKQIVIFVPLLLTSLVQLVQLFLTLYRKMYIFKKVLCKKKEPTAPRFCGTKIDP